MAIKPEGSGGGGKGLNGLAIKGRTFFAASLKVRTHSEAFCNNQYSSLRNELAG